MTGYIMNIGLCICCICHYFRKGLIAHILVTTCQLKVLIIFACFIRGAYWFAIILKYC